MADDLPRLSRVETTILAMLVGHPREMYGLEMVDASDGELKRGTIYVTLGRMEDKGLVESRQEAQRPDAVGLPRRLYKATGHGARVLRAWELAKAAFSAGVA